MRMRAPGSRVRYGRAVAGKDTNIGAKRAREARGEVGIGAGEPVACILTTVEVELGLPVVIAALPDGIAGCCWRQEQHTVLWVNGTDAPVRQRFTLAHELGHVRCSHDLRVSVDTFETLAGKTTDSREIQANAFAAELLAPAEGVRAMIRGEPTLEDVVLIAARYGISTVAALYRLNTLGLTGRYELLRHEIDEGLHEGVWDRLAPERPQDVIAGVERAELPRLSPTLADSALAALLDGAASVADAADAARCDEQSLADGASVLGR
jgi:Zn-dependent peptidase ImmA (M78 family)